MGTMLLTTEEVGAYIRLLCWQWEQGSVPSDPSKITRITGVKYGKLETVLEKFDKDSDGNWKNFRMEEVRTERENFMEVQRKNGKKGGRPKGKRPNPRDSQTKPMGSDWVPENETQTEPKETLPSPSPSPSPLPNTPLPPEGDGFGLDVETAPAPKTPRQPKSIHGQRIHHLFSRGPRASWSDKEFKALSKLEPFDDADFNLVEDYYLNSGSDYLRNEVQTFLNNYQGEVDRARAWNSKPTPVPSYHNAPISFR